MAGAAQRRVARAAAAAAATSSVSRASTQRRQRGLPRGGVGLRVGEHLAHASASARLSPNVTASAMRLVAHVGVWRLRQQLANAAAHSVGIGTCRWPSSASCMPAEVARRAASSVFASAIDSTSSAERLRRADRADAPRRELAAACGIFAVGRELQRLRRVLRGQRLEGVPVHSGRLWSAASSACASRPSRIVQRSLERQPLAGRGEVPAHDRRRVRSRPASRSSRVRPASDACRLQRKLDRPGADVLGLVVEPSAIAQSLGRARRRRATAHSARSRSRLVRVLERDLRRARAASRFASRSRSPARRPLLQNPPGVPDVPVVLVRLVLRPAPRRCTSADRRPSPASCRGS